jgi:hypothetical protein
LQNGAVYVESKWQQQPVYCSLKCHNATSISAKRPQNCGFYFPKRKADVYVLYIVLSREWKTNLICFKHIKKYTPMMVIKYCYHLDNCYICKNVSKNKKENPKYQHD